MQIDINTPKKLVTIAGVRLEVPQPFHEGYTLRENEASALNQTFAENIRNNFAGVVAEAHQAAGEDGTINLEALQEALNTYVAEYEFGMRRTGGGGGPRLEPRERIARDLAKDRVKELIRSKGKKVSDFPAEKLNELAAALVAKDSWFYSEADRRIKAQQKAASASLDWSELGLDDVASEGDDTPAEAAE